MASLWFFSFLIVSSLLDLVLGLKCYTCDQRYHSNCDEEKHVTTCIPIVHDACQSLAIRFDKGMRFEKKCTRKHSCDVITREWLSRGLCTRSLGSMCVHCCQRDGCNRPDPTEIFAGTCGLRASGLSVLVPVAVVAVLLRTIYPSSVDW